MAHAPAPWIGSSRRTARRPGRGGPHRIALATAALSALVVAVPGRSSAVTSTFVETCTVDGPATESGSVLISHPMVPQITGGDLPVTVAAISQLPTAVNPTGEAPATVEIEIDLDAIVHDVLENRVKPGVVAAGYPMLAPTSWVVLDLQNVTFEVAAPAGTTPTGTPVASSTASPATAAWTPGGVRLTIDHLQADSRDPQPAFTAELSWTSTDDGAPAPRTLDFVAGPVTFDAEVSVGLLFYGAPVVGAVAAPWTCVTSEPAPSLGTVAVVDTPVTTRPPVSSTTMPGTSSTAPGTSSTSAVPSTTTTWPEGPTIPAGECAVSGFDAYGGYLGVSRVATGFFRTEKIDGRWWLIDPDGHPFFSQGINHITLNGTPDRNGSTPYHDAALARYATAENWAAAQVRRMDEWGYNTVGAWSDQMLFDDRPFTVLLGMTGQDFGTGEMEDLFEPGWEAAARARAATAAASYRDDAQLVGYWSDNELHFGPDWRMLHLFDSYLRRPASSPGKQRLLDLLHERYATFESFRTDFTTSATSWDELAASSTVTAWTPTGGEATRAAWVGVVSERYFSVTSTAIRDADPDHLVLGPRFLSQTTGAPVLEAASRHVDVASFNLYPLRPELAQPLRNADPTYLSVEGPLAAQAAILDKPMLISEWSFRAADSGLPNTWPPLFPTLDDQSQRAGAYEAFVASLLETDWIVGQHWFEHADEPPAGRFDGEDSNFGLVDNDDNPYPLLVATSRTMHDCAYARLSAPSPPPSSTTTAPPATSPPSTAAATSPQNSSVSPTGGRSTGPTTTSSASAQAVTTRPTYTG